MIDPCFHVFVYGTLAHNGRAAALLDGCERVRDAVVGGMLYDIRGEYPALMLYGEAAVRGEIWRCPNALLPRLDEHEGVASGLFRRIAVEVEGFACWTYVAGPRLAHELTPAGRMASGSWKPHA